MLPLQITLEGFMSYRDKATLSFEGASLWMLSGANGAGKSTVFDAMRWTLFGRHRGGAQGQEALIHHGEQKLRVAFDLGLGDESFRLIRTLSRGGRSTWQIEKLVDGTTEKVPETDMREGYERWLHEHIGLSDETFCAAMYLAQGRGDAILSARPEERYEMLAEIVDLSAFAALHERAKSAASAMENEARFAKLSWENAPDVDASEVVSLREQVQEIESQIEQGSVRRGELAASLPWAQQWEIWDRECRETHVNLKSARELLSDAPQIERDLARLEELDAMLPPLNAFLRSQGREAESASLMAKGRLELESARPKSEVASKALQDAKAILAQIEEARQNQGNQRLELLAKLGEMAPVLSQAAYYETWQLEITHLETGLHSFPTDLDAQKSELETQIALAEANGVTLGILLRFDRERETWRGAFAEVSQIQNLITEFQVSLPKLQVENGELETAFLQAEEDQNRCLQQLISAQIHLEEANGALERFETVKDEANCYFCGQRLTAEHAANEEARLRSALENSQRETDAAQSEYNAAQTDSALARKALDASKKSLRRFESEGDKARIKLQNANDSVAAAQSRASHILGELPLTARAFFNGQFSGDEASVLAVLQSALPTAADLEALRVSADSIHDLRLKLRTVENNQKRKSDIEARLSDLYSQIAPLSARFSPPIIAHLRSEEEALKRSLETVESEFKQSELVLTKAQKNFRDLEKSFEAARSSVARLEIEVAGLEASHAEIGRALKIQVENAVPQLKPLLSKSRSELQDDFQLWQDEKQTLESGDLRARAAELNLSRERVLGLEREIGQLEKSLQNVPEAARCAPSQLEDEVEALRAAMEEWEDRRRDWRLQVSRLEQLQSQKKRLESSLVAAQNSARQHRVLSDLLGPHQLQRYLLREAENGIVDEANAVLDRISSGTLRLELRAEDDEIAGARKGAPKVLDVAIFRADGSNSGQGMLPAFLSGSQRFRVAVALALGIGRYATRGGGTRLESVIIDEGFGSLDRIGRGEMIDELKALGDELKRVILVSHQEEFSEAFPNRYLIENEDGASRAQLMIS